MAIGRRDDVQNKGIDVIKCAIGSKTEAAAHTAAGVAYERCSGLGEVDGVQQASATKRVRGDSVEHAGAWLEAQITDTERRTVIVDHADVSDQGDVIRIDLQQVASVANCHSCSKDSDVSW